MAKKTATKKPGTKKPERQIVNKKKAGLKKEKEVRRNLDLDYSTARFVQRMKNSVSFYVTDNNSENEVLVCENIDRLDKVSPGLKEKLGL